MDADTPFTTSFSVEQTDPASRPDPAQPSGPDLPTIFVQASSVGDSAAAIDELGFDLYVNALADFLVAPNTHAPLTCSVEGSWGSGKSSFMLQLRNRLRTVAPNSRTIEFNAWKYDKQEELWAAFALKVARSLREALPWRGRLRGDFQLFRTRLKGWGERLSLLALLLTWLLLLTGFFGVIVWTVRASHPDRIKLVKSLAGTKGKTEDKKASESTPPGDLTALPDPWVDWLSWSPLATSAVLIVLLTGKIPESLRKRLFEAQLEKYIDKPDYKGKAAFVDAFSDDFSKTITAYAPLDSAKIFIFIDDLDRCEAPKAADLMQAINLLIGDGGNPLIFILGLDRAKVAAAIAFKFREIIPYLNSTPEATKQPSSVVGFGDNFLEKFIQLSFRLPISSNDVLARRFIDSLMRDATNPGHEKPDPATPTPEAATTAGAESARRAQRIESGAESQRIRDIVMMVREVLDYSPRRIKTFLNAFRLALYIASSQGLLDIDSQTGEAEVTPERLGKFLVLTGRYPELRQNLASDPTFLYRIERQTLHGRDGDEQARAWLERPGVATLMSYGLLYKTLTRDWQRQYSMKDFPFEKFDSVLPSVPLPAKPQQNPTVIVAAVSEPIDTPVESDGAVGGLIGVAGGPVESFDQSVRATNSFGESFGSSVIVSNPDAARSDISPEWDVPPATKEHIQRVADGAASHTSSSSFPSPPAAPPPKPPPAG